MNPTFTVRPGILILHESDIPGNFATMFAPDGNKLLHRSDASSANDAAKRYVWAFAWDASLVEGQVFVFATADRALAAVVKDGKLEAGGTVTIKRYADGNPWELVTALNSAALVAAPSPPSPPSPSPSAAGRRTSVPNGARALVNVKGKGVIEVCGADGKVIYTVDAPIERMLLAPSTAEIGVRGDVELPLEFEST